MVEFARWRSFRCSSLVWWLLLSSCAANQPALGPPAVVKLASNTASVHICQPQARFVTFASLGVPAAEKPIDLVSTPEYDYVLFAPARLLRLSRLAGQVKVEMVVGDAGAPWQALGLDPVDGSVWIASEEFTLVHVLPSLHMTKVPLQRVAGSGGFVRLVVGSDAIYAAPTCANDAVWRIDRAGKILGSAFTTTRDPNVPIDAASCSAIRLDRDPDGHIVAWDGQRQQLQRVDEHGVWTEVDGGVYASLPDARRLKGVDVGSSNEQWYFSRAAGLFLWKGLPVFLGAPTVRNVGRGTDTVLLVPAPGGARELIEGCYGSSIVRIAATAERYAAITANGIVLGEFSSAADLSQ
jgi:hypothetical protein